jgi:Ca-activated chloride channel family protein
VTVRVPRIALAPALALMVAVAAAGCVGSDSGDASGDRDDGSRVLRVLAGSEVQDMVPLLAAAKDATGVEVKLAYQGTLDGAEAVAAGAADGQYDALWFSSNRYLDLLPGTAGKTATATKIMASPVVVGVRQPVAKALGWDAKPATWADIAKAAEAGRFSYGMTNPAASNSGFSALVGVGAALAGTGNALDVDQITAVTPALTRFFSGQKLTAGSSGWLADAYVKQARGETAAGGAGRVDGMINYESVLLELNESGRLPEPLTVVRPADGVVTADYPLTLLKSAPPEKRKLYDDLTAWLRAPDAQRRIMTETQRRPVVPQVRPDARFGAQVLVELPFPSQAEAANGIITAYLDTVRRPSRTIFVLDTSSSMEGDRIEGLRQALINLAGQDTSVSGSFARFRNREQVTMIPFNSGPAPPTRFTLPERDPTPVLAQIRGFGESLVANGNTAIYDSLRAAYTEAEQQIAADPDRFTSIVLMTDGENTAGSDYAAFEEFYRGQPEQARAVRTFTVLFGESDVPEMRQVADLTGGRTFDARAGSLAGAFKEIRGYQ